MLALALALAPVAACDRHLSETFPPDKPGAAVAVVRGGVPVLARGYGLADVEAKTPITRRTAFDLASVSKQFTATAVALLIDRGKLAPDDDVRKRLPTVPCLDPKRPVRVRDLLQQTSGLPEYFGWVSLGDPAKFAARTNADVLAGLAKAKPLRRPGERHEYTNTNYVLLAELVRAASGRSLRAVLAEEVFAPLGMADSQVADAVPFAVPNRAAGYAGGKPTRLDGPIHGDGNVFSTLDDLLRWDAAVTAGKLLRPATWRAATTSDSLDSGEPVEYGWGWTPGEWRGRPRVWHNGGWAGTKTMILRLPADRVTVIVLSNEAATPAEAVAYRLARLVAP